MLRYAIGTFSDTFITTVGIDYKYKYINLDNQRVRLEIWDTAGQERFKAITRSYLRGAQGILCVYDVTDHVSFVHVENWMKQIKQFAGRQVDIVMVGNKCDLDERRAVSYEEGQKAAQKNGIEFFECSAKKEIRVDAAFEHLARKVLATQKKAEADGASSGGRGPRAPVNMNQRNNKKGCC
jgi:small GTP-binding protein